MSHSTVVYTIGEIKKLIELNGNLINFNLEFTVKSLKGEPFKALVISDEELNSGEEIKFQSVDDGVISGTLTNNNNIHKVYFLVLKADSTVQCEVTIVTAEIPGIERIDRVEQLEHRDYQPPPNYTTEVDQHHLQHVYMDKPLDNEICIFGINIPIILLVIGALALSAIIFILYLCYSF